MRSNLRGANDVSVLETVRPRSRSPASYDTTRPATPPGGLADKVIELIPLPVLNTAE